MITNRRTWFIVLGVVTLLLLLTIVMVISRATKNDSEQEVDEESTPFTQQVVTQEPVAPRPQKDPVEQTVESLARVFIERMGSYSTQSNYQNIDDLKDLMTPRVLQWAQGLKTVEQGDVYKGTTTRVLTLELLQLQAGVSAIVDVQTQRQEKGDEIVDRLYYQDAQVHLVYKNSEWLVDGVYWGDIRE